MRQQGRGTCPGTQIYGPTAAVLIAALTLYCPHPQLTASARAADSSYVQLYIEILNHYLYYFDRGVDAFTPSVLQPVVDLIQGEITGAGSTVDAATQK